MDRVTLAVPDIVNTCIVSCPRPSQQKLVFLRAISSPFIMVPPLLQTCTSRLTWGTRNFLTFKKKSSSSSSMLRIVGYTKCVIFRLLLLHLLHPLILLLLFLAQIFSFYLLILFLFIYIYFFGVVKLEVFLLFAFFCESIHYFFILLLNSVCF